MPRPLPRSFYARDTLSVARDLLGAMLVRRVGGATLRGRIVETEAYVGEEDKACHARAGRTPRTEVMYGRPGVAYVYLTYGMHHMLNAVTEPKGRPAAVLIRAAEPIEGLGRMARGRGLAAARGLGVARGRGATREHGAIPSHALASGPAKLCQAFALDLRHNQTDLLGDALWIEAGEPVADLDVARSARIGCETAAKPWDLIPWRFFVAESRFVTPGRSRTRPKPPKTRGSQAPPHRE